MKFVTYSIDGGGGVIAGGIPSLETATLLAIDRFRYYDHDLIRTNVNIEITAGDDDTPPVAVYVNGELEAGINMEHRCETCRLIPRPRYL
jgi:hypothetical protein